MCSDIHLLHLWELYIGRGVTFRMMSNQMNLPHVDSNVAAATSEGWSVGTGWAPALMWRQRRVCVYICVYTYVCIHTYICIYTQTHVCVCTYIYRSISTFAKKKGKKEKNSPSCNLVLCVEFERNITSTHFEIGRHLHFIKTRVLLYTSCNRGTYKI